MHMYVYIYIYIYLPPAAAVLTSFHIMVRTPNRTAEHAGFTPPSNPGCYVTKFGPKVNCVRQVDFGLKGRTPPCDLAFGLTAMVLQSRGTCRERELFIDNLLVRIHFIIEVIWWSGLAPWEFEFPFPGSLIGPELPTLNPTGDGGNG